MLRKVLPTLLVFLCFSGVTLAQVGQGALKGKVIDKSSGEPLPFVNVVLEQNGNVVAGGSSDFDGKFNIKPIPPGTYDLKSTFTGYKPILTTGIIVNSDKITFYDVKMETTVIEIKEFEVVEYSVPLISKDNTSSGATITKDDIDKMPGRSATSVAQTVGGVYSTDDGSDDLNIRGSRSDANYYFIDGIKVRGSTGLPKSAIEQVSVITGGVPAQYGDITGGVISITTRGASSEYFGGIDYTTSGFKFGDKTYGLDPYAFNLLEYSISGPLMFRKDTAGNKTKPLFGFFLSGNFTNIVDNTPSAIGVWQIDDASRDFYNENPLRFNPNGPGTFQNLDYSRLNSYEKVKFKQNAVRRGFLLAGKIDVNTSASTNLTFGGSLDFNRRNSWIYTYSLLNSNNNPEIRDGTWRVYGRFTQRFGSADPAEEDRNATAIKNAYYSVQVDYSKFTRRVWDDTHRDELFNYGYLGEFRTFQANDYEFGNDEQTGELGFIHTTFVDTLVGYTADESLNPEAAQYTSQYYQLYGFQGYDSDGNPLFDRVAASDPTRPDEPNFFIRNIANVQANGGLRNGDAPRPIYNIWTAPGTQWNEFAQTDNAQFRVSATGSADIKDHAISVGFEYEQRVDRFYSVAPTSLWNIGRQYTNSHIENLDFDNRTVEYFGTFPTITYARQNASPGPYQAGDPQTFFDYNLRSSLGLDPDGIDFIDFDSYRPEDLSIEYFSADELINWFVQGNNSGLTYYGYDHHGNKLKGSPSFDDFFTKRDEFGNFERPVDAFRPIYMAGFIQDKFSFDDLVFNIGIRVDRFDANQQVLRDPYVLFPTVRAGEDEALELAGDDGHPGNIGTDYVVYVDNLQKPTSIVGYRDGNTWFNAEGSEISDPTVLRSASGIQPLLVNKVNVSSNDITSEAFEDYTPQTVFMPRIAFSFPISDEALFFAHYDVLTKRPTTGIRLDPLDYFKLQDITYTLNNPNLKPEKTIDYEVGFQQKLTNSSSLKLAAFYREQRDMVQQIAVAEAFPQTYFTYGNLDFATIKGLTVSYDLRRTGNVWMKAAYNLQFADGTGSDASTASNLIRAGKPNLRVTNPLAFDQRHTITATVDYRFGMGSDYNGPIWGGKRIFESTGANFVLNAGSGVPYSQQQNVTAAAFISGGGAALLDGSINGARLPWQFRIDSRIDRDVELTVGKGEDAKPIQMNIYLQIQNMLNTQNIRSVYRATGNPEDDGYLAEATFQNDIAVQNDEQSFRELYSLKVNAPGNYMLPRRTQLGIMINF